MDQIMKKHYLLVLALSSCLFSYAQDKGDFEYGIFAGLNISNISTIDNEDASSSRVALNIGAYGDYYFSDRWSIKGSLIYDQKGWSDGFFADETETFTTDYALNYLSVPIVANWHFAKKRNWYLNVGPYAGFLLSGKTTENDIDVSEAFKSTDFGLAFGIGVKIPVNNDQHLFIEYGAQSGFTDIFEQNEGEAIRNGRSSINIGFSF